MFDRFRRSPSAGRTPPGTGGMSGPDLSAVPPFPAELPGGLLAVDPDLIGGYVGLPVCAVLPLGAGAAEPDDPAGTATPVLGKLIAGHHAAQQDRMRSGGLNDDQIAMIQSKIMQSAAQHHENAWTVEFAAGGRASVQVFGLGDDHGDFAGYKARYDQQGPHHGRDRVLEGRVTLIEDAHYETYRLSGIVVAKGRSNEAVVKSAQLPCQDSDRTLAALAALALWAVEG